LQSRQPFFKLVVERMITGNQARGAGADPMVLNGIDGGGDNPWMLAEVEIIVAGKGQQTPAVALGPNSRARRDRGRAAKLRAFECDELFVGKYVERVHGRSR